MSFQCRKCGNTEIYIADSYQTNQPFVFKDGYVSARTHVVNVHIGLQCPCCKSPDVVRISDEERRYKMQRRIESEIETELEQTW